MTLGAKILTALALLCLLAWGAVSAVGIRPLSTPVPAVQVIYGEGEDFFGDAVIYSAGKSSSFLLLFLPKARPAYRWWTVDFRNFAIRTAAPPRTFRKWTYITRTGLPGTAIDNRKIMGEWYWHFTETGASFSGNGFTCSVRKAP
ncbi:MAG: hypothetical protein M0042_08025 [Nitrospiraceae bacterium]|nr:hypothetical protein [Nitrospiraceae bacterium]